MKAVKNAIFPDLRVRAWIKMLAYSDSHMPRFLFGPFLDFKKYPGKLCAIHYSMSF